MWNTVAVGSYESGTGTKTTTFTPAMARYINITTFSDGASIAEVYAYTGSAPAPAPAPATHGSWDYTIDFPLVPVSAAIEVASGNLLVWSSWSAVVRPLSETFPLFQSSRLVPSDMSWERS